MNTVEVIGWIFVAVLMVIGIALLYTLPIYFLWNWLMPNLFGVTKIDLLEALGISLLSGFLFGSGKCKKD